MTTRYDPGARNVLGGELKPCSAEPVTGFFRNGCCETSHEDLGLHTVCAVMTAEFLAFSRAAGNDLTTPVPESAFPASSPATAGASVRRAGRRRWMPAPRPRWCSTPPMRKPWPSSRWAS